MENKEVFMYGEITVMDLYVQLIRESNISASVMDITAERIAEKLLSEQ